MFCKDFVTSIEFDIDLHLYENHRSELLDLPLGRIGLESRIKYAIEEGVLLGIDYWKDYA